MMKIKNKAQLIENGETPLNRKARQLALESLEYALKAADPNHLLRERLTLRGSTLSIDKFSFDLKKFKNIYVVGGGKASGAMAEALEQVLGKSVTEGVVNVPHGSKNKTRIIKLHGANHPVPDEAGVEGTRQMLKIAEEPGDKDLIICLISGGGSSMMPLPRGKISLADKR